MKNICTNCQAENDVDSKYCSICGYKLAIVEKQVNETVQTKSATDKKKFGLKAFLGFITAFVIMFFLTQSFFKPSIEKQLAETANEINKTCPMTVNEYTTLKNVVALPNKSIQYNYALAIEKAEVKLDTVRKYVFPNLLENVRSSPAMKFFRDSKVIIIYHYFDQNGEFVTEYKITPEMYE